VVDGIRQQQCMHLKCSHVYDKVRGRSRVGKCQDQGSMQQAQQHPGSHKTNTQTIVREHSHMEGRRCNSRYTLAKQHSTWSQLLTAHHASGSAAASGRHTLGCHTLGCHTLGCHTLDPGKPSWMHPVDALHCSCTLGPGLSHLYVNS
jgi:hypothetical protein